MSSDLFYFMTCGIPNGAIKCIFSPLHSLDQMRRGALILSRMKSNAHGNRRIAYGLLLAVIRPSDKFLDHLYIDQRANENSLSRDQGAKTAGR